MHTAGWGPVGLAPPPPTHDYFTPRPHSPPAPLPPLPSRPVSWWLQGKLLVRFDDTNPSKEKDEFVVNILQDMADLGLRYDVLTYTSDYFPQLLEVGEKLIRGGVMYADDTPMEQMREVRQ